VTYTTLQNDVIAYSARDDVASVVPIFIRLAQREINRRVRIMEQETSLSLVFSSPLYEAALPADFQGFKRLSIPANRNPRCRYVGPDQFAALGQLSPTDFSDLLGDAELLYTVEGYKVRVNRPTGSLDPITIESVYFKAYPDFVGGSDTNAIMDTHYDLYLWASLAQLWAWADETEAEAKFKGRLDTVVQQIDDYERVRRRIGGVAERVPNRRDVV
jgi:hypothetical protein